MILYLPRSDTIHSYSNLGMYFATVLIYNVFSSIDSSCLLPRSSKDDFSGKGHLAGNLRNLNWPSSSCLRGHRKTYLTILESAHNALFKKVRYVFLRPLRPELDGQDVEARNSKSSNFQPNPVLFPSNHLYQMIYCQ
jgi:hypothetical protein